jgi:hypothetical protein
MKLNELAAAKSSQQISKVFESYFGSRLSLDQLTGRQAAHMLNRVRGILGEHRKSTARHHSERDPSYLKLVMLESALASRVKEQAPVPGAAPGAAAPAASTGATAPAAPNVKDPKLQAALKKSAAGQTLNPEEQKLVSAAAMVAQESRLRRAYRMLKESEIQQAQVVLAAQDMVDKMQAMLEDVSELQFKELPALVDSIKNQVGMDQATQFNTDATAALTGLLQNIQGAKQQLDAALGVVTGQAPAGVAAAGQVGADIAAGAEADMAAAGDELGDVGDDLDAAAADAGAEAPAAALGRAKR